MEPLTDKNLAVTSCGHKFCLECLLKHYKSKNNCPLCREDLVKSDQSVSTPRNLPDLEPMNVSDIDPDMAYYEWYARILYDYDAENERIRSQQRLEQQLREIRGEQSAIPSPIRQIMGVFSPVRNNRRQCGVCRQRGHNRRTCPNV